MGLIKTRGICQGGHIRYERFHDKKLLEKLNIDYVLVGLNAAKHDGTYKGEPWKAFHSDDKKRQNDYKLRHALYGTNLWGAYLTDVIKGLICTSSDKVIQALKNDPDEYKKQISSFKEELDILRGGLNGRDPVVIAMGNNAFRILDQNKAALGLGKILKISHYSDWNHGCGNKDYYRAKIHKELNGIISDNA